MRFLKQQKLQVQRQEVSEVKPVYDSSNNHYLEQRQKFYNFYYPYSGFGKYLKENKIDDEETIQILGSVNSACIKQITGQDASHILTEEFKLKTIKEKIPNITDEKAQEYLSLVNKYVAEYNQVIENGNSTLQNYIDYLSKEGLKVQDHRPLKKEEIEKYIEEKRGNNKKEYDGLGARAGTYAIFDSRYDNNKINYLATSYIKDCNALTIHAVNPDKLSERITILAHFDAVVNFETEIPKLLSKIPENYNLDIGVFSSDDAINPYNQLEILYQIKKSNRKISSIETESLDVNEVAINVSEGKILTAKGETDYNYKMLLPLNILYNKIGKEDPININAWQQLVNGKPIEKRTELYQSHGQEIEDYKKAAKTALVVNENVTREEIQLVNDYLYLFKDKILLDGFTKEDFEELSRVKKTLEEKITNGNYTKDDAKKLEEELIGKTPQQLIAEFLKKKSKDGKKINQQELDEIVNLSKKYIINNSGISIDNGQNASSNALHLIYNDEHLVYKDVLKNSSVNHR
jgi:hypothetical protein